MKTFDYLDFDVLVERAGPAGSYRARVVSAPSGPSAPSDFTLPWSDLELENFLLKIGQRRRQATRGISASTTNSVKQFGSQLFDAVFTADLRLTLATSIAQADSTNAGLRLRLRLADVPELADLPWEFLWSSDQHLFVALSEWTPLVRYLDLPGVVRPLEVTAPLRVLVVVASPPDLVQLDAGAESALLRDALADLERRNLVLVDVSRNGTLAELQRRLRRQDYHVLHFIGHGGYDPDAQVGLLAFESAAGPAQQVQADHVAMLLHDHRTLRLAVLNSCEGARGGRQDPYAGTAQTIVRLGVPAVVAMQFEITDAAAVLFSQTLYESIADGLPVDAAVAQARQAIRNDGNAVEWATPVLYLRAPDGRIFDVTAGPPAGAGDDRDEVDELPPVTEDADFLAAQDQASAGRWDEVVRLLSQVNARHPDQEVVTERLTRARRQQQLEVLDLRARLATEDGRWPDAVFALERIVEIDAGYAAAVDRLQSARREVEAARAAPEGSGDDEEASSRAEPIAPRPRQPGPEDPTDPPTHWLGEHRVALSIGAAAVLVLAVAGSAVALWPRQDAGPLPRSAKPLDDNWIVYTTQPDPAAGPGAETRRRIEAVSAVDGSKHQIADTTDAETPGITRDRRTLTYLARNDEEDETDGTLMVLAADGTGERELASPDGRCAVLGRPAWGVDDKTFVARCQSGDEALFLSSTDGSVHRRLATGDVRAPTVSADGSLVAFWSGRANHGGELAVVPTQGGQAHALVSDKVEDPAWSPEGSSLLYAVVRSDGRRTLIRAQVVYRGEVPVLSDKVRLFTGDLRRPTWSPDGTRIAFRLDDGIAVIDDLSGAQPRVVAPHVGPEVSPVWSTR